MDLRNSSLSLQSLIKELDDKLTTEFKLGVEKINWNNKKGIIAFIKCPHYMRSAELKKG